MKFTERQKELIKDAIRAVRKNIKETQEDVEKEREDLEEIVDEAITAYNYMLMEYNEIEKILEGE